MSYPLMALIRFIQINPKKDLYVMSLISIILTLEKNTPDDWQTRLLKHCLDATAALSLKSRMGWFYAFTL